MSEQRQSSAPQQPPQRPRTVHKQHSVVLYIVILFLAACLLILLSYLMQQRNNAQMLDGLNQSVSAMQSITQLQDENKELTVQVGDLKGLSGELQEKVDALTEETAALRAERDRLDRSLQAMDWFWQIDEAYARGRYSTARGLIEEMTAAGLTAADLPAESASDTGRFSPADRYQEIYDRLY